MSALRLSVVVPVYGCVGCLEQLCARLVATLAPLTGWHEIILVDDRSPDNSWTAILQLRTQYPSVRGVLLSRNFGQHIAITAGLQAARGDAVVVMDCDLQDPPEMIPQFVAKMQEGYDVVMGRRGARAHSGFRLLAAKLYFTLLSRLSEEKLDRSYGTFSILSRKAVDAFLRFGERERHYLFIVRWLGFTTGEIAYDHAERTIGCSSYSLKRLIQHAASGMFFQSTVFLRWIVGLGLAFAATGGVYATFLVLRYLIEGSGAPGWTSLAVLLLICTGVILTCMGVIGLYIGKIFDQTRARPLFLIDTDTDAV